MTDDVEFYRFLVENMTDGVYFVDRDRTIISWNRGAQEISGFPADDIVGHRCPEGLLRHVDGSGRNLCVDGCPLEATMTDGQAREAHIWMTRADGSRLPVRVRATPIVGKDGEITGAVEVFTDDTADINARSKANNLAQLSVADTLTGLGNLEYLLAQLSGCCDQLARHGWAFGLLVIDVDHIDALARTHGQDIRDRALTMVARTLAQTAADPAVVARIEETRFAVIQPAATAHDLQVLGERLRRMVAVSRLMVDQQRIRITVSIGATMAADGELAPAMLRRAATQCTEARRAGRNTVVVDAELSLPVA